MAASIDDASPLNYGVVLKKLQRYAAYSTGFIEKGTDATWYSRDFSDPMFPEARLRGPCSRPPRPRRGR